MYSGFDGSHDNGWFILKSQGSAKQIESALRMVNELLRTAPILQVPGQGPPPQPKLKDAAAVTAFLQCKGV